MKQINEDYAFEQRRQAQIDAENSTNWPQWHQKVGTVIPFSRTVDRDPNPRIPLSVPEHLPYMGLSGKEALVWLVLVGLWLGYLFFWSGAW
jgi:hypothetical protein